MSKQNPSEVTRPKFDEMCSKISCKFIIEGYAKQTVFVNGVEFVITGGVGSGNGGWSKMWGYRVVAFHKYTGDLPVMNYSQHIDAVRAGTREGGYSGPIGRGGGRERV